MLIKLKAHVVEQAVLAREEKQTERWNEYRRQVGAAVIRQYNKRWTVRLGWRKPMDLPPLEAYSHRDRTYFLNLNDIWFRPTSVNMAMFRHAAGGYVWLDEKEFTTLQEYLKCE